MSTAWSMERMHIELESARRLARRWVRLIPVTKQVAPYYGLADGQLTILLNPVLVGYEYASTSSCPKWMRKYINGRSYDATGETETIHDKRVQQVYAYGVIETAIIRQRGFNGYIQDELPF